MIKKTISRKRTSADVIREPQSAANTYRERVNYLNMPEVQRSLAIERAGRQEPIIDVPRQKKATPKPAERRNTANEDIFGDEGMPRKR